MLAVVSPSYEVPELEYGRMSTTMTGVMERTILPGLQGAVSTTDDQVFDSADVIFCAPVVPTHPDVAGPAEI